MFNQLETWQTERLGKFTASEISKLLVKGKGGDYFGQTAKTYIRLKAAEILTLEPNNGGRANSFAMEWGNSHEYEAVARFEKETGISVEYFGGGNPKFFEFSNFSGGSPDGIIKDHAIIEVKCPFNSAEHLEHLLFSTADDIKDYVPEYYWQMIANMLFTGLNKAYFISYDPRYADENLQIKVVEFDKNKEDIELLKERILEAEKQLSVLVKLVRNELNVMVAEYDTETQSTIIK